MTSSVMKPVVGKMGMAKLKAKGQRGSWFAEVEGQRLPCVHQHWCKNGRYHDPNVQPGIPPWPEFIDAITRERRVILTRDVAHGSGENIGFTRNGYIAIFAVDDVALDGRNLTFRFTQRLDDLE